MMIGETCEGRDISEIAWPDSLSRRSGAFGGAQNLVVRSSGGFGGLHERYRYHILAKNSP